MNDPIRDAIQQWLDGDGDGWTCSGFAVVMGLERIRDGEWEHVPYLYAPSLQPEWVTDGLVMKADELQHQTADEESD